MDNKVKNKNNESKKEVLIEWRRRQVLELISKGNNQAEISNTLHVSEATICKDLEYLKEQSCGHISSISDDISCAIEN